jgi:hypothetical protein
MFKLRKQPYTSKGQALVEFALIAVLLLMVIFLIIEAARIMWAWGTVQNAARTGARYAITGQADRPDCAVQDLPKFNHLCEDLRVASVINRTHEGLSGLPLNELSGAFEDDNYYNIEVWGGVRGTGELRPNFAGTPNEAVVVRAYYRVPIITPFFRPILPSIPVFGQAMMNNEAFGQLGGTTSQGAGIPSAVVLPTVGVTPTPTETPTATPTNAVLPTTTQTATATATQTPATCRVRFDREPIAGDNFVLITGEIGTLVQVINLSTGETISSNHQLRAFDNHLCPGFATVFVNQVLIGGMALAVESSDGSIDIAFVLGGTPTPTIALTETPTPTATPTSNGIATNTPTVTPTATPAQPYIYLRPNCGSPSVSTGGVEFTVFGVNWPPYEPVVLYWAGEYLDLIESHSGFFARTVQISNLTNGSYSLSAVSGSYTYSAQYTVPCSAPTIVPTPTATGTPQPADLIVVGVPQMIVTGTPVAYQPITYRLVISNTGQVNIQNQFFVDLFFDPVVTMEPDMLRLPLSQSSGYLGVSSLPGGASRVITITSDFGFANEPVPHYVYAMVDSVEQISEFIETNNISTPDVVQHVITANTPTPTPSYPSGNETLMGFVQWPSSDGLDPLLRARVSLYDQVSGQFVKTVIASATTGFYRFENIPPGLYRIEACGGIDVQDSYFGIRTSISVPSTLPLINVFTNRVPCP